MCTIWHTWRSKSRMWKRAPATCAQLTEMYIHNLLLSVEKVCFLLPACAFPRHGKINKTCDGIYTSSFSLSLSLYISLSLSLLSLSVYILLCVSLSIKISLSLYTSICRRFLHTCSWIAPDLCGTPSSVTGGNLSRTWQGGHWLEGGRKRFSRWTLFRWSSPCELLLLLHFAKPPPLNFSKLSWPLRMRNPKI